MKSARSRRLPTAIRAAISTAVPVVIGVALGDLGAGLIATIGAFQLLVFRQPLENVWQILIGLALVVVGLTAFVAGLEIGLFPLGQQMAYDFARKGSLGLLLAFAFTLGFGASCWMTGMARPPSTEMSITGSTGAGRPAGSPAPRRSLAIS